MQSLKKLYSEIKSQIDARLAEFQSTWEEGSDLDLLREGIFCLCTPQSSAKAGWKAATLLTTYPFLDTPFLVAKTILSDCGVRFSTNKTKYILEFKNRFSRSTRQKVFELLTNDVVSTRNRLAEEIKGWGLKEASHFLRNIGFGFGICILDRHIMRNLAEFKIIPEIPQSLNKKTYLEIEQKMLKFAKKIGIPSDALDLLFWYRAKNEIFK